MINKIPTRKTNVHDIKINFVGLNQILILLGILSQI